MSYQLRKETEENYVFENEDVLVDMDARGFGYLKDYATIYRGCYLTILNHEAYIQVEEYSELISLGAIVNYKKPHTKDTSYKIDYEEFLKKLAELEGADTDYQLIREDEKHFRIETKDFKVTMGRLNFGSIVDRVNILGQATLRVSKDGEFRIVGRVEDDTIVGEGVVCFKGNPMGAAIVFGSKEFVPRLLDVI
jgi:hypothetical protein